MPTHIPLILDCDPGLDDFIAILMILAAPEKFNLLGITISAGNAPLLHTAQNALKACELAGRSDVKVYAGCSQPLLRKLVFEEAVYGETGLKGAALPPPTMALQPSHAIDFLIDTLMNSSQKVTLATTGPLTNLAVALIREPKILDKIEEIVTMGGAIALGNITPAAEFNFYADPEAAHILYTCGAKITTIGLDLTHQIVTSLEWFSRLDALENPVAHTLVAMLRAFYEYDIKHFGLTGGALHDPSVIGYLLNPSLFTGRDAHVEIDTSHGLGRGRSIVDWWQKRGLSTNSHVLNEINVKGFFELLTDLISRYEDNSQYFVRKAVA
ncbi:MAG: nucleoside hydrolase [Alphaproteobacteria bacterium]|jgi:purine nucleosidase|nr:nucleoside hydrolase [Alphaproteobacteria bacterium]MBP7729202.1 nucleoside hydrolase [Alphaproteobacteria bacterium]